MSVTVVGSIAFDAVTTPFGSRERMLGGSAVHFSLAASFFADVRVVGPVGDLFGRVQRGELRAVVGGTYPLSDAGRAHSDLQERRTTGKLLLDPSK